MTRAEAIARETFIWLMLAGIYVFCMIAVGIGYLCHIAFTGCDLFINWTKTAQHTVRGWGR